MKKNKLIAFLCSVTMAVSAFSGFVTASAATVDAAVETASISKGIKLEYDEANSSETEKVIKAYAVGYTSVISGAVSVEVPAEVAGKITEVTAETSLPTSLTVTPLTSIQSKNFLTAAFAMDSYVALTDGYLLTFNIKLSEDISADWTPVLRTKTMIKDEAGEVAYGTEGFEYEPTTVVPVPVITPEPSFEPITKGIKLEYDAANSTATEKIVKAYAVGYSSVISGAVSLEVPAEVAGKITEVTAETGLPTSLTVTPLASIQSKNFLTAAFAMDSYVALTDGYLLTFDIKLSEDLSADWIPVLRTKTMIKDEAGEVAYGTEGFGYEPAIIKPYTEATVAPSVEPSTAPTTSTEPTVSPSGEPTTSTEPTATAVPADPRPTQMPRPSVEPSSEPVATAEPDPSFEPITKGIKLVYDAENSTATDKLVKAYAVGYTSTISGAVSIEVPAEIAAKITEVTADTDLPTTLTVTPLASIQSKNFLTAAYAMDSYVALTDGYLMTFDIKLSEDISENWIPVLRTKTMIKDEAGEVAYGSEGFGYEPAIIKPYVEATPIPSTEPSTEPSAEPTEAPVIGTAPLSSLISADKAKEAEDAGKTAYVTIAAKKANGEPAVYGVDYVAKDKDGNILTEEDFTDMIWAYDGNKASDAINNLNLVVYTDGVTVSAKLQTTDAAEVIDSGDVTITSSTPVPSEAPGEIKFSKWSSSGTVSMTKGASKKFTVTFKNYDSKKHDIDYEIIDGDNYVEITTSKDNTVTVKATKAGGTAKIVATLTDENGKEYESDELKIKTTTATSDGSGSSGSSGSGSNSSGSSGIIAGAGIYNNGTGSISIPGVIGSVGFTDLGEAAWASDAITYLAERGIVNGRSATQFVPNDSITRAEFAQLVVNLYQLNAVDAITVDVYPDVAEDQWYYKAISICSACGIVTGYPDGYFYPNNLVSRQEMAVMMYRAAKFANTTLIPVNELKTWSDPIGDWAYEAVSTLQQAGVVNGTSDTTFEAEAGATRAQAAQMIYNLCRVAGK